MEEYFGKDCRELERKAHLTPSLLPEACLTDMNTVLIERTALQSIDVHQVVHVFGVIARLTNDGEFLLVDDSSVLEEAR